MSLASVKQKVACEVCGGVCGEAARFVAAMVWVMPSTGHVSITRPLRLSETCYGKTVARNEGFGYDKNGHKIVT